jgi:hypothetical protein
MTFENTKKFARQLDSEDKLNKYRDEFIFPKVNDKKSNLFQEIHWSLAAQELDMSMK